MRKQASKQARDLCGCLRAAVLCRTAHYNYNDTPNTQLLQSCFPLVSVASLITARAPTDHHCHALWTIPAASAAHHVHHLYKPLPRLGIIGRRLRSPGRPIVLMHILVNSFVLLTVLRAKVAAADRATAARRGRCGLVRICAVHGERVVDD